MSSFSEEQVLKLWGPPKTRGVKNGQDYFDYESENDSEHGATIFIIIPIPLDVYSGHYQTILYFEKDMLVRTSQESDNEQGTICSPLFMFEGPNTSPCVH